MKKLFFILASSLFLTTGNASNAESPDCSVLGIQFFITPDYPFCESVENINTRCIAPSEIYDRSELASVILPETENPFPFYIWPVIHWYAAGSIVLFAPLEQYDDVKKYYEEKYGPLDEDSGINTPNYRIIIIKDTYENEFPQVQIIYLARSCGDL